MSGACRRTFPSSSSPTTPSRCGRSSSTSGASTAAGRRCSRCTRRPSSTAAASSPAYKELQLGIDIVVNEDTQNCNLLKAPPFSSFPSQVRAYIDDEFHSFVGCASEAVAFSHMPPFKDKTVRLESHCACCFAPVTLVSKNFEMQSVTPPGVFLHISLSPYDWNNVDMSRMCDSMNYVLDAEHAERYEKQTATRGMLVNLDQAKMFVQNVANERMYNFHWKPGTLNPRAVIKGFKMMGVDTSPWE